MFTCIIRDSASVYVYFILEMIVIRKFLRKLYSRIGNKLMQNKKACGTVCVFLVRYFVGNGIFWVPTLLCFPKSLLQVEWSNVYKDAASYAIYDHITPITGLLHLDPLFRCIPFSLWRVWLIGVRTSTDIHTQKFVWLVETPRRKVRLAGFLMEKNVG